MPTVSVAGVRVQAPDGFAREETMVSLRVPASEGYVDPRTSTPVRPNLIVHRRPAGGVTELARVVAKVRAELQTSIPALSTVDSQDLRYADGAIGVLLAYALPAPKGLELVQLHALRLDGDVITSLTISTERGHLTDELKARYVDALASASLEN